MKAARYLEEEVVVKKAIEALLKELGPVEAARFINMPRRKRLESVKRHRQWQKKLDETSFLDEVLSKK
ncbi:MAG: hypothetical protein ACUZ8A_06285 [Candidatus Bathyanammoxibius sp.]